MSEILFLCQSWFSFSGTAWNNSRQVMLDMNVLPGNRHIISWSLHEASMICQSLYQTEWLTPALMSPCHHISSDHNLFIFSAMNIFIQMMCSRCVQLGLFLFVCLFSAVWDLGEHNTSDLCPQVPEGFWELTPSYSCGLPVPSAGEELTAQSILYTVIP